MTLTNDHWKCPDFPCALLDFGVMMTSTLTRGYSQRTSSTDSIKDDTHTNRNDAIKQKERIRSYEKNASVFFSMGMAFESLHFKSMLSTLKHATRIIHDQWRSNRSNFATTRYSKQSRYAPKNSILSTDSSAVFTRHGQGWRHFEA